mmetsp:Transcript_19767/g.35844  ORF Transcript_19767/g.35844 Transcript_19767/m.35844 type:complete len:232 (-) Transcript_19767:172-867(-)
MTIRNEDGVFKVQDYKHYNKRFSDNLDAWLCREMRKKQRAEGQHLGFGFAHPRPAPPPPKAKPFTVLENGFTSGRLITRTYDGVESPFRCETVRTDPYHTPNHMNIMEEMHYEDRRSRSSNPDPRARQPIPADFELSALVSDKMVLDEVNKGRRLVGVDENTLDILFAQKTKPVPGTWSQLNTDLSCVDLPSHELKADTQGGSAGSKWQWCVAHKSLRGSSSQPSLPPVKQ